MYQLGLKLRRCEHPANDKEQVGIMRPTAMLNDNSTANKMFFGR